MGTIAERLFDATTAESDLEALIEGLGIPYEHLGWDYYDWSLEIHGCPGDFRPDEKMLAAVSDAGFCKLYVNHIDKWETHYSWDRREPFKLSNGWRVSYPHKRGDDGAILVEEQPPGWPNEWFQTGYAVVVKAA